jgi:predicted nucleic acid-binding protein
MLAVSDTFTISALASIGRLSLLKSQFSNIWIPTAVSEELKLHPDAVARASIETAVREKWIQLASASTSRLLSILSLHLHLGEAEVIALATDIKADVVLIDEQEGREMAAHIGLSVIGVLGILLRAKLNGEIPALKPEIVALRANARFFIASSLEAKILSAAGE